MIAARGLVLAIIVYLGVLALVGWRKGRARTTGHSAMRYGLSLATLCSAWTYFAGVGAAGEGSWLFLANALGPVIAITVMRPVWRRVAVLAKQENVGSLADFLAARFGKSRPLGVVVTLVAALGTLPYFALQFEVLVDATVLATGKSGLSSGAHAGATAALVAALAAMAIGFGTQRPGLTRNNRALVSIISLESLVKISGLLAVAGLCLLLLVPGSSAPDLPGRLWSALPSPAGTPVTGFVILTLLCTVTAFTLPRQFHLGFVALEATEDITPASGIVSLYFGLWVMATLVIASAMRAGLAVPGAAPVMQVLAIPLAHGVQSVALLAWLGGFSAGAAMVIVELTAMSGMVSNEIVLPLLRPLTRGEGGDIAGRILRVRRATVLALALLAWLYDTGMRGHEAPVQLGVTALAAFAQFTPSLFGGLWWRGGHARGAIAGIAVGFAVWAIAVAAPAFVTGGGDPLGWSLLAPDTSLRELAIAASLVANTLTFVIVSTRTTPRLIDTIQADAFVASAPMPDRPRPALDASVADLHRLLATFLGEAEAERALADLRTSSRPGEDHEMARVSPHLVRQAERVLAGVIGAPSARNVIALALAGGRHAPAEITHLLDEAGHAVHFSRELLQTTLESLPQGVCMLDREGAMIAWNGSWLGFFGLGTDALHVGRPFAEALALPPAWPDGWRQGLAFDAELPWRGDLVLSLRGRPLASGDFLMTLADITEIKRAEQVLAQNQEVLEARVAQRTAELTRANADLDEARHQAELATNAQQRFVAAASHDLVQPLHAARLFIGNARMVPADEQQGDLLRADLLRKADESVEGANRLLGALLKLSQIEVGALAPQAVPVDAGALLAALAAEFEPMAQARGLSLVVLPTRLWLLSDRDLLRSLLQNLLVNALRYTPRGRVVLCARRAGADIRIEVRDSGVGIDAARLPQAFGAFTRLAGGEALAEGAGLGLAIVARIAQALDHRLSVRSREGAGSTFAVTVPMATRAAPPRPFLAAPIDLAGLTVLCVEDDEDVRIATCALIRRWGGVVTACEGLRAVPAEGRWDVVIADYMLGDGDGLSLLRDLADRADMRVLITATPSAGWPESLPAEGIALLAKPLGPLALQAVLRAARKDG